jgi:HSP20 family protein
MAGALPAIADRRGADRAAPFNPYRVEEGKMYVMTTRRALDPFQNLRRLNSLLDDAFTNWPAQPDENAALTASWAPVCDVFEDKDSAKIVAEIPGVKPEDVKISIENQVLTIRGEKKQVAEEKTERVHRYERSYGLFERSFALPKLMDADKIEATYDNGILTVTLPKAERARPREISVKVG